MNEIKKIAVLSFAIFFAAQTFAQSDDMPDSRRKTESFERFHNNEIRAELVINDEYAKTYFAALEAEKEAITTDLGYALSWHNPENSHTCRLYVRKSVNLRDQQTWLDQHRWLLERLEDLHRVFAPRVRVLTVPAGA